MEERIARKLARLSRKNQRYLSVALKKYNLSAAEQPFFVALQNQEGLTQEELTAIVCVDKAVTARVVRSLEEKGLLIRLQDERDRRQNRLYPTPAAREIAGGVLEELIRLNALLTRGIAPETLETVCGVLLQMEQNLAGCSPESGAGAGTEGQGNGTS